jgi:hypothetical protein
MATHLAWRAIARSFFYTLLVVIAFAAIARVVHESPMLAIQQKSQTGTAAAAVPSPFVYEFESDGILHEEASSDESSSPYWWVSSGGKLLVGDGVGKTMQGEAKIGEAWRARYARSSSEDTGSGKYPQNLFRLLTRSDWDNVRTEISFRAVRDNATNSPNRNESNGLLLMSRYQNSDNLYYAGLRVDGHAVIKKKSGGTYYTMAEEQVIDGAYKRGDNLLPKNEWITLRVETKTENDTVRITLFRKDESGEWERLVSAVDRGQFASTPPITGSFPLGIRTDFMDVEFDDFRAEKI